MGTHWVVNRTGVTGGTGGYGRATPWSRNIGGTIHVGLLTP
jgi:hypothetical protein